ncbi:hypothetical protein AP058_00385 [Flavobacterium sp. TAB 87]|nr:hypothetical protein AP058_00385 [Flavobacterium sp. TAB 87]
MFPCLSKTLLGVDCLGCGFQRALLLLFQGEFKAAFLMYPAIFSSLLFLIFLGLYFLDQARNYKKALWILGIINAFLMIGGYAFKHWFYII